jgi:twinkle protein
MTENPHQPCPYCGSSDAYSINSDTGMYHCFSCGAKPSTHGSKGNKLTTTQDTSATLTDTYTEYRGIKPRTLQFYGVKDLTRDGKVVGQGYPYADGVKYRVFPKTFRTTPNFKSDTLCGLDKFSGGSEILLTEGEVDMLSAFQMLNGQTPCVSLPSATPSRLLWANQKVMDTLGSFSRIYCSFDSDGKSDHIIEKLISIFPNQVYALNHGRYKDANEFLVANAKESYVSAKRNARKVMPKFLANTAEDFLSIIREDTSDTPIPTGHTELDSHLEGLFRGHMYVLQAPEGTGKTEIVRSIEAHILQHHPEVPIAVMHLEESEQRYLLGLASYILQTDVTRKSIIPAEVWPEVEKVITDIGEAGNLYLFQMSESEDPASIIDRIRYMAAGLGVQYVFFEPIQDLSVNRADGVTEEQFLSFLSTKLALLAKELKIGIITVAHENDDGKVRSSRMISKKASVVLRAVRDKDGPEEEKNIVKLVLEKNRPTSYRGPAGSLHFDIDSFTLKEV